MFDITNLKSLQEDYKNTIIYECIAGSKAYGTANEQSDIDTRGIFILPTANYLSIVEPIKIVSDSRRDTVYYTLARFLQLASLSNPNIIELLYLPSECILKLTPYAQALIQSRSKFISKRVYNTYIHYALSQIKKASGQNKWVNNPKQSTPPAKENFCWLIRKDDGNDYPFRPITLAESGIDLSEYHVSSLEHTPNVYRLYCIGVKANGVFRGDNIVCRSISKDEETRCIGLLIYNKMDYETALKEHHNYWCWRKNRNKERWQSQEKGDLNYDVKNMMHMFRLLMSSENILREGYPLIRFEGDKLQFLLDILNGSFQYDTLLAMANKKMNKLADLYQQSSLPENPDIDQINTLLYELTCRWEENNA